MPDTKLSPLWNERPALRFTPPSGWMNDPNGLFTRHNDAGDLEYHLCYQYDWPRSWGHARTRDLLTWEHLPVALRPGKAGDCWSGSAVADPQNRSELAEGGFVAIYTAWRQDPPQQVQAIAYSKTGETDWTHYEENPVLAQPDNTPDFRDPKVFWHEPTKAWIMVLAAGKNLAFYRSPDLKQWRSASVLEVPPPAGDGVWECPDLYELQVEGERESVWILSSSYIGSEPFPEKTCAVHVFYGQFDGRHFTPLGSGIPFSGGPDDYAPISWDAIDGNPRIAIGWMNHWSYGEQLPTEPWQGMMTTPRELRLRRNRSGGLDIWQTPAPSLLQRLGVTVEETATPRPSWITFRAQASAEISLHDGEAAPYLTLRVGRDTTDRGLIEIERPEMSGLPEHFARKVQHTCPCDGDLVDISLLLDAGGVEVFANGSYLAALCPVPHHTRLETKGVQDLKVQTVR